MSEIDHVQQRRGIKQLRPDLAAMTVSRDHYVSEMEIALDDLASCQERCEKLEWLVEVQERFGIAVMNMGTGIELRTCALDELQESYRVARDNAGIVNAGTKNNCCYQWAYSSEAALTVKG